MSGFDFAETPEPPYYAVIFSSRRTGQDNAGYAEMAARMDELAKTMRTPDTLERIEYENSGVRAHDMFVHEGLIDEENYKTLLLLEIIDNDHMYFILERKKHFERPRPSEIDPTLETAIPNPPHAAYPSGHAAQSGDRGLRSGHARALREPGVGQGAAYVGQPSLWVGVQMR